MFFDIIIIIIVIIIIKIEKKLLLSLGHQIRRARDPQSPHADAPARRAVQRGLPDAEIPRDRDGIRARR